MTRLIILCVSMLGLLCFLLSFEQEAISVPCTEIESPCQTYEILDVRCVTGLYSTNFTSVPNTDSGRVSTCIHGNLDVGVEQFTEFCGRKFEKRIGDWYYIKEGCGGRVPDFNCGNG